MNEIVEKQLAYQELLLATRRELSQQSLTLQKLILLFSRRVALEVVMLLAEFLGLEARIGRLRVATGSYFFESDVYFEMRNADFAAFAPGLRRLARHGRVREVDAQWFAFCEGRLVDKKQENLRTKCLPAAINVKLDSRFAASKLHMNVFQKGCVAVNGVVNDAQVHEARWVLELLFGRSVRFWNRRVLMQNVLGQLNVPAVGLAELHLALARQGYTARLQARSLSCRLLLGGERTSTVKVYVGGHFCVYGAAAADARLLGFLALLARNLPRQNAAGASTLEELARTSRRYLQVAARQRAAETADSNGCADNSDGNANAVPGAR